MSAPEPFPWERVTAFGLGPLRWSPDQFWRATPLELAAAARGLLVPPAPAPATAGDLRRLMAAFPDRGA